jgi:asparagine synthase (glutamine-hydrolysing)
MTVTPEGSLTQHRYWTLPSRAADSRRPEDWREELEAQLKASVKRRLIADVPVGTFMSGGVDSTTVSALASSFHPGIKAFTLGFGPEGEHLNEVDEASATARLHPMQHILKTVEVDETLRYLDEIVLCLEEPSGLPPANYVISKFVSENDVTVVLNGLGGDELFCGYGRQNLAQRWSRMRPWRHLLATLPPIGESLKKRKRLSALRDFVDCYVYDFSILHDHDKRLLFPHPLVTPNSYDLFHEFYCRTRDDSLDPIETICYCDLMNFVGNHHVYRVDQFTMRFSLEARFPFLDHELVELAFRMPSELKVVNGVGKHILREVAWRYIAPSCLDMKKKGFGLPIGEWIAGPLKPFVEDKIRSLKKRNLLASQGLDRIMREYGAGRRSHMQVWMLVSVEMWLERFIDGYRGLHAELTGSTDSFRNHGGGW